MPERPKQLMIELIADALRCPVEEIDTACPIHHLGLDSLESADIARRLTQFTGSPVGLGVLLGDLSLDQIAAGLENKVRTCDRRDVEFPGATPSYLSYGQLALWAHQQIAPASTAYNLAYALKSEKRLDADAMAGAYERLIERHEALRTVFPTERGKPYTRIPDSHAPDFLYETNAAGLDAILGDEAAKPFDLSTGPLVRLRLYDDGAASVLLLVVHHSIADFWSVTILLRDLFELYQSERKGTSPRLPVLESSYSEFVADRSRHVASAAGDADLQYWMDRLAGQGPALDIPPGRARPRLFTNRGAALPLDIPEPTVRALRELSSEARCTLFVTALAGWFALLHRWTGQDDLSVGVPTSGRDRPEWLDVVGYFVNPVALRARFDKEMSARALIAQVRKSAYSALQHQNYPFPLVVEKLRPKRDPSRSPVYQSMFVWQTPTSGLPEIPPALAVGTDGVQFALNGINLSTVSVPVRNAQLDVAISLAESDGALCGALKYNTDVIDGPTAVLLSSRYSTLLASMARNPDAPLSTHKL